MIHRDTVTSLSSVYVVSVFVAVVVTDTVVGGILYAVIHHDRFVFVVVGEGDAVEGVHALRVVFQ